MSKLLPESLEGEALLLQAKTACQCVGARCLFFASKGSSMLRFHELIAGGVLEVFPDSFHGWRWPTTCNPDCQG